MDRWGTMKDRADLDAHLTREPPETLEDVAKQDRRELDDRRLAQDRLDAIAAAARAFEDFGRAMETAGQVIARQVYDCSAFAVQVVQRAERQRRREELAAWRRTVQAAIDEDPRCAVQTLRRHVVTRRRVDELVGDFALFTGRSKRETARMLRGLL